MIRGVFTVVLLSFILAGSPRVASCEPAPSDTLAAEKKEGKADFIIHHIVDGDKIDFEPFGTVVLPKWKPIQIGSFQVDLSPTKHTVFLWFNTFLILLLALTAASAYRKNSSGNFVPSAIGNLFEIMIEFIRDDIAKPMIGEHHYKKFLPFLLSAFLFVLISNFMGLIPFGLSITGNINVTAALALVTFLTVHIYSGKSYWKHIFLPHVPLGLYPIMIPVEILGMFTKPFALAVRLFANMTGGHLVILTFIGLIFILESYYVALLSVPLALFIYLLELLVCLIQAYVFTMLSGVFIGMAVQNEEH
ncbi:MAG: F0F1 ATP synthase subunit A [Bacteroidetes bacterium]|nr:F0F1 ATP synthase subunit A [Bacteroidota bacterium]